MKNKQIVGLIVAAVVFIVVGISSVLTHSISKQIFGENLFGTEEFLEEDYTLDAPLEDYIAVVEVVGTIQEQAAESAFEPYVGYQHNDTLKYIDQLMQDDYNQGILLYVDSPGGTVYESEELYLKLKEYKEETERPVWAYMAHYAASGGYMVSMAADVIYANPNTTTGSIGVIMSGYDLTGLYEKLGIEYVSITSGANKDSSQLNETQIAIYQEQVNECYERFVDIVEEGREMSEDAVKALADGRTYTGKQAWKNGLVDTLSLYPDMQDEMCKKLDVYEIYEWNDSEDIFADFFVKIKELIPKSEAQILKETAEEMESGVLMYYAEQLQ